MLEAVAVLHEMSDRWPPLWRQLTEDICAWFEGEVAAAESAMAMLLAAISHHGRPVSLNDYDNARGADLVRYWQRKGDYDPLVSLDQLAGAVRSLFPQAFAAGGPLIDATPALQQRFAGLVMLADWIGSDTQFFAYRASEAEDRPAFARTQASRALAAIGLTPPDERKALGFQHVFGFPPSPLQVALSGELPIEEGTRLLLVESDTGSGKTEAALSWWLRLYTAGDVDGLYFALPTRVAARELYERVRRTVDRAFDAECRPGPVLLAAPGYVKVDGQRVDGHRAPLTDPVGVLWDDRAGDVRRERLWAAERPKRFLAAPVAVGTVDQALLSVLRVKHSLLRSVCLDRHLLVVDEVHASDPYMREVLRALLRGHIQRGGWALLLSATLGESAAAMFFERELEPMNQALERPYPALTDRQAVRSVIPAKPSRSVAIDLDPCLEDDDALLPDLAAAIDEGARVLVVCNTVARATALFRVVEAFLGAHAPSLLPALFETAGTVSPHHGRFARADREVLDARVGMLLGKNSPTGPRLLIGTQTLEQSLDIDADWLVTDLAPMDVLLQRIGRLHRHDRTARPARFGHASVRIRIPARALDEYLDCHGVLRAPAGLGRVYPDGRVLKCTLDLLAAHPTIELPADARKLIEGCTHPVALDRLSPAWQAHGRNIEGKELAEIRVALGAVLDEQPFGDLHYPDKTERIATRLGAAGYDVPLLPPMRSPFGTLVDRIAIPSHFLPDDTQLPETIGAEAIDGGFRFRLGKQTFRYTRFGLEKDDA